MSDQPVVVTPKPFWESKTVWVNGLVMLGALIMWLIDTQTAGALPFTLDAKWLAFILAAVNFVLRFVTDQPVTAGKE